MEKQALEPALLILILTAKSHPSSPLLTIHILGKTWLRPKTFPFPKKNWRYHCFIDWPQQKGVIEASDKDLMNRKRKYLQENLKELEKTVKEYTASPRKTIQTQSYPCRQNEIKIDPDIALAAKYKITVGDFVGICKKRRSSSRLVTITREDWLL